jgi:hypothetical protein
VALRGPANRPRPHGGCPENRTRHAHRRRFYRPAQSPDLATPDWLQRTELNGLPRGYEPRELPMLHAASKVARLELTRMRRSTSVRSQNWRTAEVLIPNALRHPSRFERAHGTRRIDCPSMAEDCELESHTREGASRFPSGAGTPARLVFHVGGGRAHSKPMPLPAPSVFKTAPITRSVHHSLLVVTTGLEPASFAFGQRHSSS